jgi:hypothetical protein
VGATTSALFTAPPANAPARNAATWNVLPSPCGAQSDDVASDGQSWCEYSGLRSRARHVVAKDAALAQAVSRPQPRDALALVRKQARGQARGEAEAGGIGAG